MCGCRFSIELGALQAFANDERTRSFLSLEVNAGADEVRSPGLSRTCAHAQACMCLGTPSCVFLAMEAGLPSALQGCVHTLSILDLLTACTENRSV